MPRYHHVMMSVMSPSGTYVHTSRPWVRSRRDIVRCHTSRARCTACSARHKLQTTQQQLTPSRTHFIEFYRPLERPCNDEVGQLCACVSVCSTLGDDSGGSSWPYIGQLRRPTSQVKVHGNSGKITFLGYTDTLSDDIKQTSTWNSKLAATLHGSRPGVQSASLIMTSLMTS